MAGSKSVYELQREKNIEANNAVPRSLGLLVEKNESAVSKAPTVAKRKKEEDVVVLPSRKSARLNNVPTVHQEVYTSSDDDEDSSSRKRSKKKANNTAPLKDSAPSRQSKRRSEKILPEVTDDFDDESDDDLDNIVFNVTEGHAGTTYTDSLDFDPYGFDTTSADGAIRLPMPNDGSTTPDGTVDDSYSRPMFVPTMFFMDSDTLLCPQV